MQMIEPRVVRQEEASKSLVYHVEMAQRASFDLRYVIKFMSSAAEVKRVQRDKELAKEMQAEEERLKAAYIAAQDAEAEVTNAATKIQSIYRSHKAMTVVRNKYFQVRLERLVEHDRTDRNNDLVTRIQRLVRQYLTRMWFASRGVRWRTINQFHPYNQARVVELREAEAEAAEADGEDRPKSSAGTRLGADASEEELRAAADAVKARRAGTQTVKKKKKIGKTLKKPKPQVSNLPPLSLFSISFSYVPPPTLLFFCHSTFHCIIHECLFKRHSTDSIRWYIHLYIPFPMLSFLGWVRHQD